MTTDTTPTLAGQNPARGPHAVTLANCRKAEVDYVDLWTKGTAWPTNEDPMAAIHFTGAGFETFHLPPAEDIRAWIAKNSRHPQYVVGFGALTRLLMFSQFDVADAIGLFRDAYHAAKHRLDQVFHDDVTHTSMDIVVAVARARTEARVGVANPARVMAELLAHSEELRDRKVDILHARASASRSRNEAIFSLVSSRLDRAIEAGALAEVAAS